MRPSGHETGPRNGTDDQMGDGARDQVGNWEPRLAGARTKGDHMGTGRGPGDRRDRNRSHKREDVAEQEDESKQVEELAAGAMRPRRELQVEREMGNRRRNMRVTSGGCGADNGPRSREKDQPEAQTSSNAASILVFSP